MHFRDTCMACGAWMLLLLFNMAAVRGEHSMRANIFVEDPLNDEDFGPPPVTDTVTFYDCSSSHRESPRGPEEFQVYHNSQWWTQTCPQHLVWNQTLCRCDYPGGSNHPVVCRDYRPSRSGRPDRYEQVVNGRWLERDCSLAVTGLIWNQEACQCAWGPQSDRKITGQGITPCDVMLNVTFDDGLNDAAKGSFIELSRGDPVSIVAVTGIEGFYSPRAAYFSNSALNIWYFADNELGSSLRVEFTFKLEADPKTRDTYHILLSNGCNVTSTGFTTPSLAIGYRPSDQTYLLAFETTSARKAIVCQKYLGAYDWHTVSLIYEDGTLLLRVDGHPCIISQDFSGPVQKTPCPLMLGADPLGKQSGYNGYLDNLVIARYCRRYLDKDTPQGEVVESVGDEERREPTGHSVGGEDTGSWMAADRGQRESRTHNQPYLGSFDMQQQFRTTQSWYNGRDSKNARSWSMSKSRTGGDYMSSSDMDAESSLEKVDPAFNYYDDYDTTFWYSKPESMKSRKQIPKYQREGEHEPVFQKNRDSRRRRYETNVVLENNDKRMEWEPMSLDRKYGGGYTEQPTYETNDDDNSGKGFWGRSKSSWKPQETSEPRDIAVPEPSYNGKRKTFIPQRPSIEEMGKRREMTYLHDKSFAKKSQETSEPEELAVPEKTFYKNDETQTFSRDAMDMRREMYSDDEEDTVDYHQGTRKLVDTAAPEEVYTQKGRRYQPQREDNDGMSYRVEVNTQSLSGETSEPEELAVPEKPYFKLRKSFTQKTPKWFERPREEPRSGMQWYHSPETSTHQPRKSKGQSATGKFSEDTNGNEDNSEDEVDRYFKSMERDYVMTKQDEVSAQNGMGDDEMGNEIEFENSYVQNTDEPEKVEKKKPRDSWFRPHMSNARKHARKQSPGRVENKQRVYDNHGGKAVKRRYQYNTNNEDKDDYQDNQKEEEDTREMSGRFRAIHNVNVQSIKEKQDGPDDIGLDTSEMSHNGDDDEDNGDNDGDEKAKHNIDYVYEGREEKDVNTDENVGPRQKAEAAGGVKDKEHMSLLMKYPPYNGRKFQSMLAKQSD